MTIPGHQHLCCGAREHGRVLARGWRRQLMGKRVQSI